MIKTITVRNATLTKVTVHDTIIIIVTLTLFLMGETVVESDDTSSVNAETTVAFTCTTFSSMVTAISPASAGSWKYIIVIDNNYNIESNNY